MAYSFCILVWVVEIAKTCEETRGNVKSFLEGDVAHIGTHQADAAAQCTRGDGKKIWREVQTGSGPDQRSEMGQMAARSAAEVEEVIMCREVEAMRGKRGFGRSGFEIPVRVEQGIP